LIARARTVFTGATWQSPQLLRWNRRIKIIYASKYTVWLLFAIGIIRAVVFLVAYPPAHGADSADYFLYAAQFEGLDAPIVFELIYPLYPLLIYLTHYWLGSIYILIGWQLLLSSVQGVIFYMGLRLYSPLLAFLAALMVLGDAQTGILYNFTSTEPLYMFALSLSFSYFLVRLKRQPKTSLSLADAGLGALLALVLLARPVGRYLIVPFGLLFWLGTRSWRRTGVVVTGFAILLVIVMGFNQLVFNHFELNGGGNFMLVRPLVRSGLLEPANGPASARLVAMQATCDEGENISRCLVTLTGDWPAVRQLYTEAYMEMIRAHPVDFGKQVFDAFHLYLRQTGLQYKGEITPSDVQCADIEGKVARDTQSYLEQDWLLYGTSDLTPDTLRPILRDIAEAMCPPLPDNDAVRSVIDQLAFRYRSLSRPRPFLWYALVVLAVVLIPWARPLMPVVFISGAIVANHAAISAVVLNVQPRYIAIVNPYKGVLLLVLLYVAGRLIARLIDEWMSSRNRRRANS